MIASKFVSLVLWILAIIVLVNSSTTPHRLFPLETPLAHAGVSARSFNYELQENDPPPPKLSIVEGDSVRLGLNTSSYLTLNLNRGIEHKVQVLVSIYSGPDLIIIDEKNNSSNPLNDSDAKSSVLVTYDVQTFGDKLIKFHTNFTPGHAEFIYKLVNQTNTSVVIELPKDYVTVDIYRDYNLTILIYVVGWIYFFAWSISFYAQLILNYKRKSVIGLSFDFIALNVLGFACYTIYNFTMLFSHPVQEIFYQRYAYSRIPVEYNDLFFALHGFLISTVTMVQCFIYERGQQRVSIPASVFIGLSSILAIGLYIASIFKGVTILDVVIYLSYVKLAITTIKYTPQAYMNYRRKATTGWSVHNILLDFTGGSFSLAQMILIAYNYNDWVSVFGNFSRFGLAVVSITFDILFMLQHYVFYRGSDSLEDSVERLNPVISESIRSASYTPQQQQPPTPGLRNEARFAAYNENESQRGIDNDNYNE